MKPASANGWCRLTNVLRITPVLLLVGFAFAQSSGAKVGSAAWQAGVAKVKITPEQPMWMAGYAGRPRPASAKIHDLWAKALVLQDAQGARAVLVTLDVTGIDRRFSLRLRDELKEKYGLERRQIALCSSHTHSGPVTSDRFTHVFGLNKQFHRRRLAYLVTLHEKIVVLVGDALGRLEPCRLRQGTGTAGFAFNRRNNRENEVVKLRADGKLRGPMDLDVPVLAVESADGKLLAVGFGYACHCTTLGPANGKWCGDYAGFAQANIETAHPGCTALFWAGCGGDQNPGPRRNLKHVEDQGLELATAVEDVLTGKSGAMRPVGSSLRMSYREVELPFASVPTVEQLRAEAASKNVGMARRAKFILERLERGHRLDATYPYPVQAWFLGRDLLFVMLGGEAVVDYALRIKEEYGADRTWVASYANDVMAYIPSLRVLREGGYEGRTSMMIYGLPAPWGPQIEPRILLSLREQVRELGARPRPRGVGATLDFENTSGVLDESRWYVSGGMNATRLRTAARSHQGSWALSTAGDFDYPTFFSNVSQSRIDANTSVAWGPFFELTDNLLLRAKVSFRIAGGAKPWNDSAVSGPAGVALWDVAAADFVRHKNGKVRYATCETNGFDFEAASIPLTGLAGKTVGLVLVDRATQSWAWTSVDDVVITSGGHTFSARHHHEVTILGGFDDPKGLSGWTGDTKVFQVAHTGRGRALFVNRTVRGTRQLFPANAGYLGSAGALTGTLRSPEFRLDGHILEFYLAGDGGRLELVAADGKVLARTTPASSVFVYDFFRIEKKWRGTKGHIRVVDDSTSGGIDVDAVRMVRFDVESDETKQPAVPRVERSPPPNRRRVVPRDNPREPRLVARVFDNRSGGKTVIHPAITYSFSTAQLNGEIRPRLPKPGIVRCRHKPTNYDVLTEVPQHALLMPEWLLKPGNGRKGIFWAPLRARPTVQVDDGSIVFRVDAAQTRDWNMDVAFRYTPEKDWIDFECTIDPHVAIEDFEFFIASYVTEDMESTWVSAATADGEEFRKIDCRQTAPWGSVYTVSRDAKARACLEDGRWKLPPKEAGKDLWQDYYFKRPILIAMKESTGLAVVTMVDPAVCSLLAGQHHRVETAHDFAFNTDLVPKRRFTGRARVVIRRIGRFPQAKKKIDRMWEQFVFHLRSVDAPK